MLTPSVTRVIAPWTKFDHVPEDVLTRAAERGTRVHEACRAIAEGIGFFPMSEEDRAIAGYVQSFRLWFEAVVKECIFTELELLDDHFGFVGHPDLFALSRSGDYLLVDLKSPVTKSKTWRLQLAAYAHLCREAGYVPDRIGSLRLHPEGKAPKMDWYEESTLQDFNVFLSCLNAYRFFNS